MARYDFILRDEELDLELPITIYSEEPLEFDLAPGAEPDEDQLATLINTACSGDLGTPEVTDAFLELRDFLINHMMEGIDEWDDDVAQRLGRLIGIASFFDAGVNIWKEYLGHIIAYAEPFAGNHYVETGPHEATASDQTRNGIQRAFEDESLKLLRRIDARLKTGSQSILNFEQLRQVLQINEHDLRQFLNAMLDSGRYPATWNVRKRWRIPATEQERVSQDLSAWLVEKAESEE